jgi:hypothetical protein
VAPGYERFGKWESLTGHWLGPRVKNFDVSRFRIARPRVGFPFKWRGFLTDEAGVWLSIWHRFLEAVVVVEHGGDLVDR